MCVSLWRWRATEAGREKSDALLLKLPLVGPFIVSQTVLAFSQTLGVLLANGITAAEALRMTERQIRNRVHQRAFDGAIERVMEGEMLSSALTRTGCFPELVLDRICRRREHRQRGPQPEEHRDRLPEADLRTAEPVHAA